MNAETSTIRLACADDAPELARLSAELNYPSSSEAMRQRWSCLEGRSDHAVFVAESANGILLGWAHVARTVSLESGERGELLGLIVDRRARRAGVGRKLVAAAEQWIRGQSLRRVVVRSNVMRTESHLFYPTIGYTLSKMQQVYVKELGVGDSPETR